MPDKKAEKPRSTAAARAEEQDLAAQLKAVADSAAEAQGRTTAIAAILDNLGFPKAKVIKTNGDRVEPRPGSYDVVKVQILRADGSISKVPEDLAVHHPSQCSGYPCSVHHPSENHMRNWPMLWNIPDMLMLRQCPHGMWHPDWDHIAFAIRNSYPVDTRHVYCCKERCCEPHFL